MCSVLISTTLTNPPSPIPSLPEKKNKNSDRHRGPSILPHSKHFEISHFKYVEIKGKCKNISPSKQPRMRPIPRDLTLIKNPHKRHNKQRDDTLYEALVFMATTSCIKKLHKFEQREGRPLALSPYHHWASTINNCSLPKGSTNFIWLVKVLMGISIDNILIGFR